MEPKRGGWLQQILRLISIAYKTSWLHLFTDLVQSEKNVLWRSLIPKISILNSWVKPRVGGWNRGRSLRPSRNDDNSRWIDVNPNHGDGDLEDPHYYRLGTSTKINLNKMNSKAPPACQMNFIQHLDSHFPLRSLFVRAGRCVVSNPDMSAFRPIPHAEEVHTVWAFEREFFGQCCLRGQCHTTIP